MSFYSPLFVLSSFRTFVIPEFAHRAHKLNVCRRKQVRASAVILLSNGRKRAGSAATSRYGTDKSQQESVIDEKGRWW